MRLNRKRGVGKKWLIFPLLALLAGCGWIGVTFFEGKAPAIRLTEDLSSIGAMRTLEITAADKGQGIKEIWVGFLKDGKEIVLHDQSFGKDGLASGTGVLEETVTLDLAPAKLGITDGEGTLRIRVRDASWRRMFKGNIAYLEKKVTVDTKPPVIEVLTRKHYLRYGGTGLVAYRVKETVTRSGVMVDGTFYPGISGYGPNKDVTLAYFAVGHVKGSGQEIYVMAEDAAGNRGRMGFPFSVIKRRFPEDRLTLSERFLSWKMPAFRDVTGPVASPLEQFLIVNRKIRKENSGRILDPSRIPEWETLWQGAFLQLPKSANRAGFADRRIYLYKDREVDRQYHLGIDLASVKQAPIPAANTGRVVMNESVGIYGKTVVLDHGGGLYSHYSHMTTTTVAVGDRVQRGEILGTTGVTGLVAGDHLHFGMMVSGTFVDPIEWLDPKWVENNIASKLRAVATGL